MVVRSCEGAFKVKKCKITRAPPGEGKSGYYLFSGVEAWNQDGSLIGNERGRERRKLCIDVPGKKSAKRDQLKLEKGPRA